MTWPLCRSGQRTQLGYSPLLLFLIVTFDHWDRVAKSSACGLFQSVHGDQWRLLMVRVCQVAISFLL